MFNYIYQYDLCWVINVDLLYFCFFEVIGDLEVGGVEDGDFCYVGGCVVVGFKFEVGDIVVDWCVDS